MASRLKAVTRQVFALTLVTALVAGCTPHPGGDAAPTETAGNTGTLGDSALGSFLAGRLAQGAGDTRAAADYYANALRYDPDDGELMQRAFTLLVAEGRMGEAAPLADRLLALDTDAAIPLLVAGLRDAEGGNWAQAESRFALLPKRGIFSVLSPLMVAWTRTGAAEPDQALEALAPLAQINGLNAIQAYHSGLMNDIAGRNDAAETGYLTALSGTLSIRSVEAAGSFYQRTGRTDKAAALYQRYSAEHPESLLFDGAHLLKAGAAIPRSVPDARAGLAEALFDMASLMRQGNAPDLAMVFIRLTLSARPDFPLAQMTLADLLSGQERYAEANDIYRAIAPGSAVSMFGRLRVAMNLDELGKTDAALTELDKLAKEDPNGLDALVTKGDVLRRKKRFAEAAEAYDQAIKRVPTLEQRHWALLYSRGVCYERSREWAKAEADFLKALQLQPDQPDVLNYLGYSWVDQGIHLDQARAMIERAVNLRPRDGAIVDSLGWALYRMGDYRGAVNALERAIELKPEDPTINDHLGDAYFQVGRFEEATFQWKRAMTLDPEPEQIAPLQEKIQSGQLPTRTLK